MGEPKELCAAPADIDVAFLIESPAINKFSGQIAGPCLIQVAGSDIALAASAQQTSGPIRLALRPEAIAVGAPTEGAVVLATGHIETVEWLGAEVPRLLRGIADSGRPWAVRSSLAQYAHLCTRGSPLADPIQITAARADLHVFNAQGHRPYP